MSPIAIDGHPDFTSPLSAADTKDSSAKLGPIAEWQLPANQA
jgi:hypothetical protein